jgi:hypothetical protein
VSSAGDVNDDGIDDLIIGAPNANPNGSDSGASYVVFGNAVPELDLNGIGGFVLNGIDADDRSGRVVSNAGDVNGDGLDDLIIGAYKADPNSRTSAGESYVVFGNSIGFSRALDLSSLNGSNGFVINGISPQDFSGYSVSSAGDLNDDGIDDLIIGAHRADSNGRGSGASYVVFGQSSGFSSSLNLSSLNGSNGFAINGSGGEYSGFSVSSAGDINGDGIDDIAIAIGSANALGDSASSGLVYVVFGQSGGFSSPPSLSSLNGSNGFAIDFNSFGAGGRLVDSAGDVNGDGIDDLIIGSFVASPNGRVFSGRTHVVFGQSSPFSTTLNLSSLDGSNGFSIDGIDAQDRLGHSISGAGDFNGDGIDDIIIGAPYGDPNGRDSGESYVVFGQSSGFSSALNLSSLNGNNGFVINGSNASRRAGFSVSGGGDVNGDGLDDLIIGSTFGGSRFAGESYVVFGKSSGIGSALNLSSLDGSNGFAITGVDIFDRLGSSVSIAGDINGDGIDDIILGAPTADPNGRDSGESYVVFGEVGIGASGSIELSQLKGSDGVGSDFSTTFSGSPVAILDSGASLTDSNSDNLVGASIRITNLLNGDSESLNANTSNTSISASYTNGTLTLSGVDTVANYQQVLRSITYSNSAPTGAQRIIEFMVDDGEAHSNTSAVSTTTVALTASQSFARVAAFEPFLVLEESNSSVDTDANQQVNGGRGNDDLQGGNGDDTLSGRNGSDTLRGGQGNDLLNGGNGRDRLEGDAGGDRLLGGHGVDSLFGGSGNDVLDGGNLADVLSGGSGNDVLIGGRGSDSLTGGIGADQFVLTPNQGRDVVFDYLDGVDTFGITDGLSFADLVITNNASGDALIQYNGSTLATILGSNANALGVEDFQIL